ncbi:succinyldiaminopimelate transaminase [Helicobacter sp. NHP22-001]|uniref:succinyldiaminopimelate transaminase n=1 Tax=Helicobacter sp. NHP22-001 TaxID=3040202 RepID=UPI00244D8991|nr:succinyldiaminopimelate transaminase [Helicobacter sp. NHP22-001]GMB96787.1 N-succinyldiaminopimelate aminotransferase [Helicobacter sp. NHP22-001]
MFEPYPFERLRELLKDCKRGANAPLDLSIGEPQFETPLSVQETLKAHTHELRFYPKSSGEDFLKEAQMAFVKKRFGVELSKEQIIPTFGSKEVLFSLPIFYLHDKEAPIMAFANPFYQVYLASARVARAQVVLMDLSPENNFTPTLEQEADLVILNSPNNPTGRTLDLEELKEWVLKALDEDFLLVNDECYSNIYAQTPPPSILQACMEVGNTDFKNVLAINSLSKTLSAPGLRSAYIAGDATILKPYQVFRSYSGCALPLPLQHASAVGWLDLKSQEHIRHIYAKNLNLAQEILGVPIYPTSFYVWLEVREGQEFTKHLYTTEGIKVLPGDFLGYGNSPHTKDFVRVALVYAPESLAPALNALKNALDSYLC